MAKEEILEEEVEEEEEIEEEDEEESMIAVATARAEALGALPGGPTVQIPSTPPVEVGEV